MTARLGGSRERQREVGQGCWEEKEKVDRWGVAYERECFHVVRSSVCFGAPAKLVADKRLNHSSAVSWLFDFIAPSSLRGSGSFFEGSDPPTGVTNTSPSFMTVTLIRNNI